MERRSRLVPVIWLAIYFAVTPAAHAQEEMCRSQIPPNIDAGIFAAKLLDILDRSETFRRQCLRIAETRVLKIRVGVTRRPGADYRAITFISRYDAGALRAEVTLMFAENYVELLAHEFEHVLEQVDGVNLRALPDGASRELADGSFETRRAAATGLQVLHEYEALAPEAAGHHALRLR